MFTYTTVMERPPLPADAALPEEVSSDIEGLGKTITVNVYERSSQARRECLQAHGTSCSVCGFSFAAAYGAIGLGYIHVHHLTPLSHIKQGHAVNGAVDLRPVCPNCHAMLHTRNPPWQIEELRAQLSAPKN